MKNKAFTLIELLVVVLIIGILAAIAVPKYQLSVDKSKAKMMLAVMQKIKELENSYKLQNGNYTTNFNNLDINFPYKNLYKGYQMDTSDGIQYTLDSFGTYYHVSAQTNNIHLYLAFPVDVKICYIENNERKRKLCGALGCAESSLNNNSCFF